MVRKGPGVAVRPPPGTTYRVYGLFVKPTPPSTVHSLSANLSASHGNNSNTNSNTDGAVGVSVAEYDGLLAAVAALPLGRSLEERASVRGYAWTCAVPPTARPFVWRLLCHYANPRPAAEAARQSSELRRKREEYEHYISKYYHISIRDFMQPGSGAPTGTSSSSSSSSPLSSLPSSAGHAGTLMPPYERAILTQIALDLPRHALALFRVNATASALARCLFLWSLRYPAVGYVQGIDDIMAVFFLTFLQGAVTAHNVELQRRQTWCASTGNETSDTPLLPWGVAETRDVQLLQSALAHIPAECFRAVEADTYGCGGFFLSWLQEVFTPGQPALRRGMARMEEVLLRADAALHGELCNHGVSLMDCCFQWMHCLLARELPLELVALLWDKYLAMGSSELVLDFHVFVCVALLMFVRGEIVGRTVDVLVQRLKDPLGMRGKSQPEQQRGVKRHVYDRQWMDEIITQATKLSHTYPVSSLE